jgi:hypothetical protein
MKFSKIKIKYIFTIINLKGENSCENYGVKLYEKSMRSQSAK